MAIVEVMVPVSKEAFELSQALLKLILEVKKLTKDGVGADDIPALLGAIMSEDVVAGVKGIDQLGSELKENPEAFINAFATLGSALVKEFQA